MGPFLSFFKYEALGNDFILFADMDEDFFTPEKIISMADRHKGIGGDGVVLVDTRGHLPTFKVWNADGSTPRLCGNALRCAFDYLYKQKSSQKNWVLCTEDGLYEGECFGNGEVEVKGRRPVIKASYTIEEPKGTSHKGYLVDSGVPHFVIFVDNIRGVPVDYLGPILRRNENFKEGANITWVSREETFLRVRTYERGVEAETRSCGTGTLAAAFVFQEENKKTLHNPSVSDDNFSITVYPPSNEPLTVRFDRNASYLKGRCAQIFQGILCLPVNKSGPLPKTPSFSAHNV